MRNRSATSAIVSPKRTVYVRVWSSSRAAASRRTNPSSAPAGIRTRHVASPGGVRSRSSSGFSALSSACEIRHAEASAAIRSTPRTSTRSYGAGASGCRSASPNRSRFRATIATATAFGTYDVVPYGSAFSVCASVQ